MIDDIVTPLRGVRKMVAERLMESVLTTARATLFAEADASAMLSLRVKLKGDGSLASLEDILLFTVAATLRQNPSLNGTLSNGVIVTRGSVDLGVAIDVPEGLVAPAILAAQDMTLDVLSTARRSLVNRARNKALTVAEMTGGSFTVSNLGQYRVGHFVPLINPPQLAILGVGKIQKEVRVGMAGGIVVAPVVRLSLSVDHRAIDGAAAAKFLDDLCGNLEAL